MKKIRMIFFLFIFFLLIPLAMGQGAPPAASWWGTLEIDGNISTNGAIIEAFVSNEIKGNTTVGAYTSGYYLLDVACTQGQNITIKVYGVEANQSGRTCSQGTRTELNLTMNKSANGVSCTYANGCSGGYCVHNFCSSSSTYCGDGYCDSGESCSSDNSACSSGYACTNGCVATSSGGGGGGGAATIKTVALENVSITIPTIAAGKMANISIIDDVAFRQINISVSNSVSNVTIIITKLLGLPASVTQISGKVYKYIEINKENITDTDISKVFIKFAVNKTWLTQNNIATSNISLYRWANNRWNELTTTYLSEDASEVFYQAESPGLSYFLIGTRTISAPTGAAISCTENWSCAHWSACVNNQQTRTCTDARNCGTTVNKPAESQNCIVTSATIIPVLELITPLGLGLVAVIAILAIIIIIIFKKRKFVRKQKTQKISVVKQGISGGSFLASGIVVTIVPAIIYIFLGNFVSLLQYCTLPFSAVNLGNNVITNCIELRFYYTLSYFCLLFGLILIMWGLIKKVVEEKYKLKYEMKEARPLHLLEQRSPE
jgi:PGF-pre-PGF domain-containing protein